MKEKGAVMPRLEQERREKAGKVSLGGAWKRKRGLDAPPGAKEKGREGMFANYQEIKKRVRHIEGEIKQIEEMEKNWPAGELICTRNSGRYKWYLKNRKQSIYLPKRERKLAQELAQKKYHQLRRTDLKRELSACQKYIHMAETNENLSEKIMKHAEYERLLGGQYEQISKELEGWMKEKFEKNTGYPENLIVKGTQGKMLRSKSEAIIDKMLYSAGIPFRYEDKLVFENMVLYPDFTIRHPLTGEFFYWEHFGLMDDYDYVNRACQKIKIYCDNGIIPSVNLILTYETKDHPLPIDQVEMLIKEYFM